MGHGAILPGEPITFDLFPATVQTGVYTDMTHTYVVGEISDELREYHRLCKEALDRVVAAVNPASTAARSSRSHATSSRRTAIRRS